jgi:hypothetical protein
MPTTMYATSLAASDAKKAISSSVSRGLIAWPSLASARA